jgi:phage FluMu gp28-like protein
MSWSTAYACVERTGVQKARWDQWVSSRDELQAKLFVEDCKLWSGIANTLSRDLGEILIDADKKQSAYVLELASGKRIHSMSSNPDAQAGKRGSRVLDEFALHPDPRKLWSIAYPGITWGGQLEVISTHRGSANYFNELIREVRERGNPKKISLHRVTLQDALEQGFLFKLQQMLPAGDNRLGMNEAEYFDFVRAGCADEESFQQEYMCNPADDNSKFLEYGLITSCEYSGSERWERALEGPFIGPLFIGLDIGRKKDLSVLCVLEKLGDTYYVRALIRMDKMRKSEQEKVFNPWFEIANRNALDYTGLGIGWGDDAQDKFGAHRVDCVTLTAQTKERLAWLLKGTMQDRRLRIPPDPKLRAALRKVNKVTSITGQQRFVAESDADGHADEFWALALALSAAESGVPSIDVTSASAGDIMSADDRDFLRSDLHP